MATVTSVPAWPGAPLEGRYRLDDRIGAGGMGEVWRATDLVLDRLQLEVWWMSGTQRLTTATVADVLHDIVTRPREVMMDVVHVRPASS